MILWLVTSVGIALVALAPLAVISLVVILARRRSRTWQGAALPVIQSMALPAAIVAALAFALRPGDIEPGDTFALNWEPFRDLRMSVESGHLVSIAVQNLAGNAAMFFPIGLAARWSVPRARWLTLVTALGALSVLIELAQATLPVGRSADVTDAIMNTVGGVVGIAVGTFLLAKPAVPKAESDSPA